MKWSAPRAASVVAAVLSLTARAHADNPPTDKASCVAASDHAQSLQAKHRLIDARAQFVGCASSLCPIAVREDCARSLLAVDAATPSVVFSAVGGDGKDLQDVRTLVDGKPVTRGSDGNALAIDPGPHVVRFERSSGAPIEIPLTAREGEKNRVVQAHFDPPATFTIGQPDRDRAPKRPFPIVPLALVGVGVLGLASAFYFRLSTDSDADRLRSSCAPGCSTADRASLSDGIVASNVSLAIGLVAIAAGAVTWLASR